MIYAILKMDVDIYSPNVCQLRMGQLVRIENHRNGDKLFTLDNVLPIGFFPKGYLRYWTLNPSKLLNLVMK